MFKPLTAACIAVCVLAAGCASSPPSEFAPAAPAGEINAASDTSYEELFLDLHAEILRKLGDSERGRYERVVLIEAESMVSIAEEMYLEGNVQIAVHLLREAAILLRQTP
jgi:hypothetical protein